MGSGGSGSGGRTGTGGSGSGGSSAGGTAGRTGVGTGGSATGGATGGTGGVPATGGSSGTGSGGSTSSCSVAPIDSSATTQAKNLLCYLYNIYGSKVLSGQQETSWSNPQGDIDYYVTTTGKHPAILGGDYLYPSGTTSRAQAYWGAGGITMMRYHMGAPPQSDTYANSKSSVANFANLTKSGTTENTSLNSKLDYLAGELKTLQSANVPVLMVIYHEVDKYAWFWWSKGNGTQFKALWNYTINYVNQTKGVHNVLWVMGYGHDGAMADYWVGKSAADLGGIDEYDSSGQPFASYYSGTKAVVGSTIPIPLHETGTLPQPSSMFPSTAPWLLWNVWALYENTAQGGVTYNTANTIKTAYADSHTVTRETLPSLK
jgi:hypothetical protein